MNDYAVDKIRNVCLLGHGGAGKTTLAEAMLYNSKGTDRFGNIQDGNTTTDYDPEEIRRKISISTALALCEWKDHKINIIDTPGYFDFVGEVKQGVRVSDGAVILASAKDGVQVGTEKSWEYASERGIPKIIFISKIDEENSDFFKVFDQFVDIYGKSVIAFEIPIIENGKFNGIVNVATMKAKRFKGKDFIDSEIPEDMLETVNKLREGIIEAVAETDEELLEKFFEGIQFTDEEIKNGLKKGIKAGDIAPVFCGSSVANAGIQLLLDALIKYVPSHTEKGNVKALKINSEEEIELKTTIDAPASAFVFKTIVDPFVGKISLFKVISGVIKSDSVLYNPQKENSEKMAHMFQLRGKEHINVEKLCSGDIGAVAKLLYTETNDTLCEKSNQFTLEKINFPEPNLTLTVVPISKGDEEKISSGLHKLQDEDKTFKVSINSETHETIVSGIGEQHLDVIMSKLKTKFKVDVQMKEPKIPYRETIRKKVTVEGKHKKQSGGHGQYGVVVIEFEPGDQQELVFEEKVFGGSVPRQYFPAVQKGLLESMEKGVLAGYPVVSLKATLLDGKYHPVDSSEMAFKIAANLAFKEGLAKANPVLLEPILHVEVYVPENYMGDIIGDFNKRRGRILGMNPQENGYQQIVAEVPEDEMFKYATDLRSMTQARGSFKSWFERYEDAPQMVADKIIEKAKKQDAE